MITKVTFGRIRKILGENLFLKKIASGGFILTLGFVIWKLSVVASSFVLIRVLGKDDFGLFGVVLATYTMFAAVAGFGLGNTAAKYLGQYRLADKVRAGRVVGLTFFCAFLVGSICCLILLGFRDFVSEYCLRQPQMGRSLGIVGVMLFCHCFFGAEVGILSGLEEFKKIFYLYLIYCPLDFLGKVCGAYENGIFGAAYGMALSLFLVAVCGAKLCLSSLKKCGITPDYRNCRKELHVFTGFTLPNALESLVTIPVLWFCKMTLMWYSNGKLQVGLYTVLQLWSAILVFIPTLCGQVLLPVLSANIAAGAYREINKNLIKLFAILLAGIGVTVIMFFFLSPFILNCYTADYSSYRPAFILAVLDGGCLALINIFTRIMYAFEKAWSCLVIQLTAGLGLACMIFFLARYGVTGIYLSSCGVHMIVVAAFGLRYYFIQRKFNLR